MTYDQLDHIWAAMELKRKTLSTKLAAYDNDLLNKKPNAEAWSVIQVMDHLLMAERGTVAYVKKKTQDKTSIQKTGIKEWFISLLLNMNIRSSKKFGAPINIIPTVTYASLNEINELWNAVRQDMKETIHAIPADMLGYNWFKHPAAGKLNLMQMLTFTEAHFDRHEKQIWRTIKAIS
jgi:hypothetical protein